MKKDEWKKHLISGFIVFLMVSSVVGFMWGRNEEETTEYEGYEFVKQGNYWITQGIKYNYFPTQVEDLNISEEIINKLKGTLEIDTTYDLNMTEAEYIALAQYELAKELDKKNVYVRNGALEENEYGLPIISCSDATDRIPVIIFEKSNTTEIIIENNCIKAKAKEKTDFIRIKDRILYSIMGVING